MRNKYSLNFSAYDGTFFTLTFVIAGGRFIHLVEEVEVYQHAGDLMCEVIGIGTAPVTQYKAQAQMSPYTFAISIQPTPTGASVYVAETSVTITCAQQPNLQPCN